MDGLIESAKNKLWDIVNELARIKPTPNLRVALYSYGHNTYDPKAGWVRKEVGSHRRPGRRVQEAERPDDQRRHGVRRPGLPGRRAPSRSGPRPRTRSS